MMQVAEKNRAIKCHNVNWQEAKKWPHNVMTAKCHLFSQKTFVPKIYHRKVGAVQVAQCKVSTVEKLAIATLQ